MSKKFTGITSGGQEIPVYDKAALHDAYSAGNNISINDNVISVTGRKSLAVQSPLSAEVSGNNIIISLDESALDVSSKLDTSAFAEASGSFLTSGDLDGYATQEWVGEQGYLTEVPESAVSGFATHEEVESATSGKADTSALSDKADTSGVVEYKNKPASGAIYADSKTLANVNTIVGSGLNVMPYTVLHVDGVVTAHSTMGLTAVGISSNSAGLTAANLTATPVGLSAAGLSAINDSAHGGLTAIGLTANNDSAWGGFTANGISSNAYYSGFSANGIIANTGSFCIKCTPEAFSGGSTTGFTFSSQNSAFGTAHLTTAYGNSIVQMVAPKFEAKNVSGAGFSIEASGAKGYDQSGNVTWDTSKPAKLIGWNNYQGTAIDPRAAGINGGIIATVYPDNIPQSMQLSSAPYTYMNGYGFYAVHPYGALLAVDTSQNIISISHTAAKTTASMNPGDVSFAKYNSSTSATDKWSLTGSVQKREIACDSATSAITAIAGSAIGGGGEVPEGVMATSGLEYNSQGYINGYEGSAIATTEQERQWFTHDDTLVHLSNSAQYALGVNLSGISADMAQMLSGDLATSYDIGNVTFAGWYDGKYPIWQRSYTATFQVSTAWNAGGAPIISAVNKPWSGAARYWIDPSNSYVYYGSISHHLPTTWMLGANRFGCVEMLNDGNVYVRCIDASTTNCTARINIKWVSAVN